MDFIRNSASVGVQATTMNLPLLQALPLNVSMIQLDGRMVAMMAVTGTNLLAFVKSTAMHFLMRMK